MIKKTEIPYRNKSFFRIYRTKDQK